MKRREFLTAAAATVSGVVAPGLIGAARGLNVHDFGGRVLVLVELNGGNDGLNTVIPYADPAYGAARAGLAIPRGQVLPLDERLGLHPALEPLMAAWQGGDLAIPLGVGYERPDRSHFRSIEIWNTSSTSDRVLNRGWAARAFDEAGLARNLTADAILLGGDSGPFYGGDVQAIGLDSPERFVERAGRIADQPMQSAISGGNPALQHILKTRANVVAAADDIAARLDTGSELGLAFPRTGPFGGFGRDLELAARIVAARLPVAAIKVTLGSFDTHANQPNLHRLLLTQLGASLSAFREALIKTGDWRRVMVMTYAEFGRRVAGNASNGTDHGTAAPHLVMGGRVAGGLYGVQPSLTDLDAGDLKYTMDFRTLLATATQNWWGLPPTPETFGGARPLGDLIV